VREQSPTLSVIQVTPPREFDIASEVFATGGGEQPGGDFKAVTRALAWCNSSSLEQDAFKDGAAAADCKSHRLDET
jgi:hypothetical protein